ncbi:4-hydroxyphenylpyruvate dioxygenase [Streptomyces diacarni]|uniref:4-hydroxyphenylpyruvate dioxygenase n=1 Tax=Streptomyces diacarni TaxID=2800381 RepID=UPI0034024F5A
MTDALRLAGLDHVELYVTDVDAAADDMITKYGFELVGQSSPELTSHRSVALRQGGILLVITQGFADGHPASSYVQAHGDGVASIALRTTDAQAAFKAAVAVGACPLPTAADTVDGGSGVIEAFGDVRHTFVQRGADEAPGALPPGFVPVGGGRPDAPVGLQQLDHFAICVKAGQLTPTVDFYASVLGFRKIFEERIVVGTQAMDSQVVQNAAGDVTLTIIEPDTDREPGQIDEFIKNHGGAGVQHLAFSSGDIVHAVGTLRDRGIEFLRTPGSYYDLLSSRMVLAGHSVRELRDLDILADEDHAGQLYQIFTRSTHPKKTLFMEVIERLGAETFGSGNIKALYEAVEMERLSPEARR